MTLQSAVDEIKASIEKAIKSGGTSKKNNLIKSQKPINLLHDAVKSEFILKLVNPICIKPLLSNSKGEVSLAGFIKKKSQDISITPLHIAPKKEILTFPGLLFGQEDKWGFDFTERTLSVNVRSQLSSSAKNFDTLYERTFAEALNLHVRCPKMVLGEVYMITVNEYDSNASNIKQVKFKASSTISKHIEKYILSFSAINSRTSTSTDHYKYERVCLLIVDFSQPTPKIYNSDHELIKDGLLPSGSSATIKGLAFPDFIDDLLNIYSTRFGKGKFI